MEEGSDLAEAGNPVGATGTLLHLAFWALLYCGIWLEWRWAMVVGFLTTIANFSGLFLPFVLNVVAFLAVLPFAQRSVGLANMGLFLLLALIFQVWQFMFWVQGAAAH